MQVVRHALQLPAAGEVEAFQALQDAAMLPARAVALLPEAFEMALEMLQGGYLPVDALPYIRR